MIEEAFIVVSEYCERNGRGRSIRDHVFCYFMEALQEEMQRRLDANESITPAKKLLIVQSYTSEAILKAYTERAQNAVADAEAQIIASALKRYEPAKFWPSVGANLFSAFLYSVILFLFFLFFLFQGSFEDFLNLIKNNGAHK